MTTFSIPLISPAAYKEYIFPYEVETSNYHGGIDYWHSCGKIDPILPIIKQIPRLRMIHISYANDFEKSVKTIGSDNIIEFVLNPIEDILKASPESMGKKTRWYQKNVPRPQIHRQSRCFSKAYRPDRGHQQCKDMDSLLQTSVPPRSVNWVPQLLRIKSGR